MVIGPGIGSRRIASSESKVIFTQARGAKRLPSLSSRTAEGRVGISSPQLVKSQGKQIPTGASRVRDDTSPNRAVAAGLGNATFHSPRPNQRRGSRRLAYRALAPQLHSVQLDR